MPPLSSEQHPASQMKKRTSVRHAEGCLSHVRDTDGQHVGMENVLAFFSQEEEDI